MSDRLSWVCVCGQVHDWGVYALAHWHERLNHDCRNCGAQRTFLAGDVVSGPPIKDMEPKS